MDARKSHFSAFFTGRLNRRSFIGGLISLFFGTPIVLLLEVFILGTMFSDSAETLVVLFVFALLVTVVIGYISISVRRLHDVNRSGWWLLVVFIPFVNILFHLLLSTVRGTAGVNQYGQPNGLGSLRSNLFGNSGLSKNHFSTTAYFAIIIILGIIAWLLIISLNYNPSPDTFNDEDTVKLLEQLSPELVPVVVGSNIDVFGLELPDLADRTQREIVPRESIVTPIAPASGDALYGVVVKIVCENDSSYFFGSGTNISPQGLIITNYHVIDAPDLRCIVGFPNPETGRIVEAYTVTEIPKNASSTDLDLALLKIIEPVSTENGDQYGYKEKVGSQQLPYYQSPTICADKKPKLGGPITILGYPPITGGSLTITDGLISSLYSKNGYLITSAKISSGNSGGMTIDANDCFIGVPTAVYLEKEEEQYGEIINTSFVNEFLGSYVNSPLIPTDTSIRSSI